jgi:hypothetical protein
MLSSQVVAPRAAVLAVPFKVRAALAQRRRVVLWLFSLVLARTQAAVQWLSAARMQVLQAWAVPSTWLLAQHLLVHQEALRSEVALLLAEVVAQSLSMLALATLATAGACLSQEAQLLKPAQLVVRPHWVVVPLLVLLRLEEAFLLLVVSGRQQLAVLYHWAAELGQQVQVEVWVLAAQLLGRAA